MIASICVKCGGNPRLSFFRFISMCKVCHSTSHRSSSVKVGGMFKKCPQKTTVAVFLIDAAYMSVTICV